MIREPALSIEINISFKQLAEAGLAEDVESILAETGLDPKTLKLEMSGLNYGERRDAVSTLRRFK